jgi:hypothetical protein
VCDDPNKTNAIKVIFVVTVCPKAGIDFNQAFAEFRGGHDVILDEFACVFTEDARKSFGII